MTLTEIVVERCADTELFVLAPNPMRPGKLLTLQPTNAGPPMPFYVRVLDSHPTLIEGKVRYRLRLGLVESTEQEQQGTSLAVNQGCVSPSVGQL